MVQMVELRELIEAIDRTRFGVNGGGGPVLFGGWRKRLREWLIDSLSDSKQMQRALPLSGG